METLVLKIRFGLRAVRSCASVAGAAALALMLAVGLNAAIFTSGGSRLMLSYAPDFRVDQTTPQASVQDARMEDAPLITPIQETGKHQKRVSLARQTVPTRKPDCNLKRRLLRLSNFLFVARFLSNEAEHGQ